MEQIYTARNKNAKEQQRQFFFWYKKEFRNKIIRDLKAKGREDLVKQLFSKKQNNDTK
jgi:hypothetical protein